MSEPTRIDVEAVRRYVADAGERGGVGGSQLEMFVCCFIEADLWGVDTHGIARIPAYVRAFLGGIVNPSRAVRVLHDSGAALHVDGDNGLGMVVGQIAMDRATDSARKFGVGVVSVRNSNHSGMLAVHVFRAVGQGMGGLFASGGVALMATTGGAHPAPGKWPLDSAVSRAGA